MSNNPFCSVISSTRKFTSLEQLCRRLNIGPKGSLSQLRRWEVSLIRYTQLRAGGASSPEGLFWVRNSAGLSGHSQIPSAGWWHHPGSSCRAAAAKSQTPTAASRDAQRPFVIGHSRRRPRLHRDLVSHPTSKNTFATSPPNTWPCHPPCSWRVTHFWTPHLPNALSTISCHHQSSSNSCP